MHDKISSRQLISLITISKVANTITLMSVLSVYPKNQDIWISLLLSIVTLLIINFSTLYFINKFNEINMLKWIELIIGKKIGKIIIFIYGIFFFSILILFLHISVQMIRNCFLPQTNPAFGIPFLICILIFINLKGKFVIFRSSEFLAPLIFISLLIFIVLGHKIIDLNMLLPIGKDSELWEIGLGSIQLSLIAHEIYIVAMAAPLLENKKDINKVYIKANVISAIFMILIFIATTTSLGFLESKHFNFPFLTYIRTMQPHSIFERVESLYAIIWLIAIIMRISAYYDITIEFFQHISNKKHHRKITYILGILLIVITYYLAEINPLMKELVNIGIVETSYYIFFRMIIPFVLVIAYLIRKKNIEQKYIEKINNKNIFTNVS